MRYQYVLDPGAGNKLSADFVSRMKAAVVPKVCNSKMKAILEDGASYEFVYQDKNGWPLGYVIVTNADCR